MRSLASRTSCALALIIGLSIVMLLPGSTSPRLVGPPLPLFKNERGTATNGNLKALVSSDQISAINDTDKKTRDRVLDAYGNLPLSFEANEGQFDPRVKFVARGNGQTLFLTSTDAVLKLGIARNARAKQPAVLSDSHNDRESMAESNAESSVLRLKLSGANPSAKITGLDEMPGKTNYFIGRNPKKRVLNVPIYAKVKYESVYPGIDLVYYGNNRELEYDLIVAPGGDPNRIRLAFAGAERIRIDESGDLVLSTAAGETLQRRPVVYQMIAGVKREIPSRYVKAGKNEIGFEIARFDDCAPLVIDPVLAFSTYLGGSIGEQGSAISVDSAGNSYITGSTSSSDFPTVNPVQPNHGPGCCNTDAFVTKLNASGSALVYSTYLGGEGNDRGEAIAVDTSGSAHVVGSTNSADFPIANALQPTHTGGIFADAFVVKLNAAGNAFVYSTYLGGSRTDSGFGIAVDAGANAYVIGSTSSEDFPTSNPLQPNRSGPQDSFVSKINPTGAALLYSTYLGGAGNETGGSIAADADGNAYILGGTNSPDFPLVNPIQSEFKDQTVFKSSDAAVNWTGTNNGLPSYLIVQTIAIDPSAPNTVYAGTNLGGVYKSTDAGSSWSAMNNGLPGTNITMIAVDPNNGAMVYALDSGRLMKSVNGGTSWAGPLIINTVNALAIDPIVPANLYAVRGSQIFRSTDGGATFVAKTVISVPPFPIIAGSLQSVALDPTSPSTIYAGDVARFLFKSTDRGDTWVGGRGVFSGVQGIAVAPSVLYEWPSGPGLAKSTDGGLTWTSGNPGILGRTVRGLAIDPTNVTTVYAATDLGVLKTTDGGDNWSPGSNKLSKSSVRAIAIHPKSTTSLYAGGDFSLDCFVAKLNPQGSALIYSTYLGSDLHDSDGAIAVDAFANTYVAGATMSPDFPTKNSLQAFGGGLFDAFVAKLNPAGSGLIYSTYIGGNLSDGAGALAVDAAGNAYLTGRTSSADFPVVAPIQPSLANSSQGDAFVTKLSSTGTVMLFSTFLGGAADNPGGFQSGLGIALDSAGSVYVTGPTPSHTFPITQGAFQQVNHVAIGATGFVSKIGGLCAYSLSRTTKAFPPEGGSASFELTSALGCPWTVVTSDSWILLNSADTGTGGATISFEVRENFEERFRIGTLAIGGQTYTVLQEGLASVGCSNAITPTFGAFPSVGGSSSINVIASEECIWEAASNASWIAITSTDTGIGVGVVSYQVSSNPSTTARHGTITIAGKTFSVKQKGNVGSGRSGARKS